MGERLKDKVALVTGAGSVGHGWGNGRAMAAAFASEGARVIAVDRDVDALEQTCSLVRESGADLVTELADVTDQCSVAALIKRCAERFGAIDVLVNNVGGSSPGGPVEMTLQTWNAQIAHNLTSVFLLCKFVLPLMERKSVGSIVNVASTSGIRFTGSPQVAYAATKAGVIQMSKVIAAQYGPKGIRVNCVVPGQLHTPMVEARLAGQRTGGDVEKLLAQRRARIPLDVTGDGRDTAMAALYLASDESRFVTGAEIVVDGGMTVRCN